MQTANKKDVFKLNRSQQQIGRQWWFKFWPFNKWLANSILSGSELLETQQELSRIRQVLADKTDQINSLAANHNRRRSSKIVTPKLIDLRVDFYERKAS